MISFILAATLLQQGDVDAFLAKDAAAESRLLEMGPYAVRPLLKVRDRDPQRVGPLLAKIKLATLPKDSPLRAKLARTTGFNGTGDGDTLRTQLRTRLEIPVFTDPGTDPARRSKLVIAEERPVIDILDAISRETGMEFGFFHGHVVLSTPERLWPAGGPPRLRKLDDAETATARKLIVQLGSDGLEERQKAVEALRAFGAPVLPLLDAEAGNADPEIKAQCASLALHLRKPAKLGTFGPALVESQTPGGAAAKILATLKENTTILVTRMPLATYIRIILAISKDLEMHFRSPAPEVNVTLHFENERTIDVLALSLQSFGLDFIVHDGKVTIDRREELEKLIP